MNPSIEHYTFDPLEILEGFANEYCEALSIDHPQGRRRLDSALRDNKSQLDALTKFALRGGVRSDGLVAVKDEGERSWLRWLHYETYGFSDYYLTRIVEDKCGGQRVEKIFRRGIKEALLHDGYYVCRNLLEIKELSSLQMDLVRTGCRFESNLKKHDVDSATAFKSLYKESWCLDGRYILRCSEDKNRECQELVERLVEMIFGAISSNDRTSYAMSHMAVHINRGGYRQQTEHELSHQALMWHTDWHGSSFVKLFIPLTDFDDDHGTHAYVPGSHRFKPVGYADSRFKDHYIRAACPEHIEFRLAPGDVLIENTSGFHKGVLGRGIARACIIVTVSTAVIDGKFSYSVKV